MDRQPRRRSLTDPVPTEGRLIQHVRTAAAWAVLSFCVGFLLLDLLLVHLIDDANIRTLVRWVTLSAAAIFVSIAATRRTIRLVSQGLRGERSARDEAEALAELTASVATVKGIQETLSIAVTAAARIFGGDVRCTVLLPAEDGLLRLAAYNNPSSARIAGFAFRPGEGFNGAAFSEQRVIRVPDIEAQFGPREDIKRAAPMRSLLVAPLIADQRSLGVISAISPSPNAFSEHDEGVLMAIARNIAVALVAAESRETLQREAAKRAAIITQMADGVIVCDAERRFTECNPVAATLFDVSPEALIAIGKGAAPWQLFSADGVEVAYGREPLTRAVGGETVAGEYRIVTHAGQERWGWVSASPLRDADGRLKGGIMVVRDTAERRKGIQALLESEERYRRLVEMCPDPIVVHCEGRIVYANTAALTMAGAMSSDEVIGRPTLDFMLHGERDRLNADVDQADASRISEAPLRRLNGEIIYVESTRMRVTYQGRPAIQAVIRDITERKHSEQALAHQALHDALTGLPNRVLLLDRLEQAVASAQRDGGQVSLLLMDLDRFKEVNDSLGHHAGDLLLRQVGSRLRGALRQSDTLARLGGDEFAVILPDTGSDGIDSVVDKLLRELHSPFTIEGQPVIVGVSIGIAVAPDHGREADALLRRADVAMYVAKRTGSGSAMYSQDQDRNSPDRLVLIGELRRAIDRGELVLHYQPKIDLRRGHITGAEALVRWQHPQRGLLSPDEFVPIAEQASLIESLSLWVLRTALEQASAWRRCGFEVPVAINLSMRSLYDEFLPDKISDVLRAMQLPPSLLVLEITESTLMLDPRRTSNILERLRAMGIRVAIDDFGTGHSSLAYLKRLAVDEVKIDRAFVQEIASDVTDRIIVRSTVDLAHSLGLRAVAEGVEDQVTATLLAQIGCDEVQGFYVSRPLDGDELLSWAHAHRAANEGTQQLAA